MRFTLLLKAALSLGLLVGFGLFLLVASACSGQLVESNTSPEVGHRAPSFEARFIGGDTAMIDDLLGNGIILNFWATWCGPCQREMPLLTRVAQQGSQDGITVIGVNMGETEEEILKFLEEFNVNFPIVLDADGSIARLYSVPALPMTFFIDGDGLIQYRRVGELHEGHITEGLSRMAKSN